MGDASYEAMADLAKVRRDDLIARGFCLNGESHGPATNGRRCLWCIVVHRVGVTRARELAAADPRNAQPPRKAAP